MQCYLCQCQEFKKRKGTVRDNPSLNVLECTQCGLVMLSSFAHIEQGHYENSGMHGVVAPSIDEWRRGGAWDDERRFDMLKPILPNKKILDFGCGACGFINMARSLAAYAAGIEPELRVRQCQGEKVNVFSGIDSAGGGYDLVTAFHVVEHLPDPRGTLVDLSGLLKKDGTMIIEVPNSEDALLTLYDSEGFQNFTYWSQHLYLFNAENLKILANQAGLRVVAIKQHQRYPLSNHLYWLSQGKPGGHQKWSFLNDEELNRTYGQLLGNMGKCDTLVAYLRKS